MTDNKSYFCDELNNTLTFFHDSVSACCTVFGFYPYYEKFNVKDLNFLYINDKKAKILSNFLNGKVFSACKNCSFLRESTPNDKITSQFKFINISHWEHCNCGCIYCARHNRANSGIESRATRSGYYDFLPILKKMYKKNFIDKENVTFCFQGGDIGVLKEFKDILKCIEKNGYKNIYVVTNNIIFQPVIKKLMDKNNESIMITSSLDCGTRETYKKIKRVDKFNDYISNLKKYVKDISYPNIKIVYLLVKDFNDNKQELEHFISLMSEIGIKQVELSIDFNILPEKNKQIDKVPAHYKDLYYFFIKLCEEHSLTYYIQEHNKKHFIAAAE